MNSTIEQVKESIKQHSIIPFTSRDITCEMQGKEPVLIIKDKFRSTDANNIMDTLGIKKNLSKDIFTNAQENWSIIRDAINSIDKNKQLSCIINNASNTLLSIVNAKVKEATGLNFDNRIDSILDAIDGSAQHSFKGILFNPLDCSVDINCINEREIDCGADDFWKYGTNATLSYINQQFQQYFLRLACTNGMTVRENVAYRAVALTKNVGKQFIKYAGSDEFAKAIKPRVQKLKDNRASLFEVCSVASCLKKDERVAFFPEYDSLVEDFANAGHKVDDFSAKRKKFIFTDQNLYDIFNRATNIATHRIGTVGHETSQSLNKVAGEIFTRGPLLDFNVLDIYSNN